MKAQTTEEATEVETEMTEEGKTFPCCCSMGSCRSPIF